MLVMLGNILQIDIGLQHEKKLFKFHSLSIHTFACSVSLKYIYTYSSQLRYNNKEQVSINYPLQECPKDVPVLHRESNIDSAMKNSQLLFRHLKTIVMVVRYGKVIQNYILYSDQNANCAITTKFDFPPYLQLHTRTVIQKSTCMYWKFSEGSFTWCYNITFQPQFFQNVIFIRSTASL